MKKWTSKITDIFKSKSYVQRRSFNTILKNNLSSMKYTEVKQKRERQKRGTSLYTLQSTHTVRYGT